jgi:nucleotide-binding universal stress UspA family protein
MYRKIIIGHDLHAGGRDALALGSMLAGASGAELVVAGVFPFGTLPRGFDATWREDERGTAAELQRVADAAGATAEAFPSSSPARGLHELAEEIGADLVVVGSSRHGRVGRILAGNVVLGLLRGAPCAVAIAPRGFAHEGVDEVTELVVGFDGSPESRLALQGAVELAGATGAGLRLVSVAQPPSVPPGALVAYAELKDAVEDAARRHLDEALASIPPEVTVEGTLISGDAATKLADAGRGSSLLMLGSRSYGPARRVLLGSVSSRLVGNAPCPVVVHPRSAAGHEAAPPVAAGHATR